MNQNNIKPQELLDGESYLAFKNWLFDTHGIKPKFIDDLGYKLIESFVIDWLDSVDIYIYIEPSIPIGYEKPDCFLFRVNNETNRMKFTSRQQATQEAIRKANDLYNEQQQNNR